MTWYEVNIHKSVGRYIFIDITQAQIYWQLLALVVSALLTGYLIGRSRLGLALARDRRGRGGGSPRRDRHDQGQACVMFAVSALFMTLTGAVMAPRWTYIDPAIAFNPMLSFEVVIMALFGGAGALFGPILGVVPFVLLFELLVGELPDLFQHSARSCVSRRSSMRLPQGVIGLIQTRICPPAKRRRQWPFRVPSRAAGARLEVAVAAQDVRRTGRSRQSRLRRRSRRDRRADRAQRLRQDHGAQPDLRRAALTITESVRCDGQAHHQVGRAPHRTSRRRAHLPARARARIHDRGRQRDGGRWPSAASRCAARRRRR